MYANIIVDISHEKLDKTFQYLVPKEMELEIFTGAVVLIPFGSGNREITGYVVELTDKAQFDPAKMKSILQVRTEKSTEESRLITLAGWMKDNYGSTTIQALKTVMPFREKMKAKEKKSISLVCSQEEAEEYLKTFQKKNQKARARLLESLIIQKVVDYTQACRELKISKSVLEPLQEKGILEVTSSETMRNPLEGKKYEESRQVLSQEQEAVLKEILDEWEKPQSRPALIYGVTGSGKTQIYMELIEAVLAQGKQVIVLIPEIALTYQTVMRFYGRFKDQISVINSRLSAGERYDQFKRAQRGEIKIMIGPRSALFTPFSQLGLILIDEEHEQTYKSENTPRYHARETAVERARLEGAYVVMGSATPSLEAYSRAEKGEYLLTKLKQRYEGRVLPQTQIIDLTKELKEGNRSILSRTLQTEMEECLEKEEQVMLFLNRRGYAGFLSCRMCGSVIKCPHCDVSLSVHKNGRMVCHYCGYEAPEVKICPVCSSPYIGRFKAGTQQIEDIVRKRFPNARTLRMDYDTTRTKTGHEKILEAFSRHEADILIGTQMIVKGHDFPNVTLVGVLAADLSLNASDYQCAERTFQLLTQACGRAGRGKHPGKAVIQAYHYDHYAIVAAARQDYEGFYWEEMSYRKILGYPPASEMMAVLASGEDDKLLTKAMDYLKQFVQRVYPRKDLKIIGPAPQWVSKVNDQYKQVIYLKHTDHKVLVYIKDKLEQYMEINAGFRKLFVQFDFS